jgi:hypothetical protein
MRSSSAAAGFGVLALLAIPAAVVAAQFLNGVGLLRALYGAVPAAFVLALVAVSCSRRARFAAARSVRLEGAGPGRLSAFLAWAGMYAAVTGVLALAVYGALRWASQ